MSSALDRAEKLTELTSIQELAISREDALARITELLDAGEDTEVRQTAVRALMSYPEHHDLWARVLELARGEDAGPLRETCLEALGRLVREGDLAGAELEPYAPELELGEPPRELYDQVKAVLLQRLAEPGSDAERQSTLLSLSYLPHEPAVADAIDALFTGGAAARALALRCVARACDLRWAGPVSDALAEGGEHVLAAIRAAGAIELIESAPLLGRIARSGRQPELERLAAVAALVRLGGKTAAPALLELSEADEEGPVRDAAREALNGLGGH
ncbi:MAG: hypothetical protein AB7N76_26165 [Planctomycetota bacterium]